jgi:hypothetical protein
MDTTWLANLQTMLGQSINIVEAEMGGATRQVLPPDSTLGATIESTLCFRKIGHLSLPTVFTQPTFIRKLQNTLW